MDQCAVGIIFAISRHSIWQFISYIHIYTPTSVMLNVARLVLSCPFVHLCTVSCLLRLSVSSYNTHQIHLYCFHLVHLSLCQSVCWQHHISLYLLQYQPDPFHIHTPLQPTSTRLLYVNYLKHSKIWISTLVCHQHQWVLSSFHVSACPSVCPSARLSILNDVTVLTS